MELGQRFIFSEASRPWVGEQSSALGMALYPTCQYSIRYAELSLGCLVMLVVCNALPCYTVTMTNHSLAWCYTSYALYMIRPDDLGKDIGSLCFRACLSVLLVHPKGGRPGGARVVTSYTSVVLGYAGSYGYDCIQLVLWGRRQVVTALSVRYEAASWLAYSPPLGYGVGVLKDVTAQMYSGTGHSPWYP